MSNSWGHPKPRHALRPGPAIPHDEVVGETEMFVMTFGDIPDPARCCALDPPGNEEDTPAPWTR